MTTDTKADTKQECQPQMSPEIQHILQMGNDLVEHCNTPPADGDPIAHDAKLWDKHFAESWESVEGDGKTHTGRAAVIEKYKWWMDTFTCHSAKATGPFIGPTGFSVIFEMDVEAKDGSMPRGQMKEVANYTVKNGKVVREEFRYGGC